MRGITRSSIEKTAVWRISQVALCSLVLLLCSPIAWSQQDVTIPGLNTYTILGRGLSWGGTTAASVNNNFIFQVLNPNTQICLYITNNNPTSSHTFTVALWQTGDPSVKSFQQFPAKWAQTITNQIFPKTVAVSATVGIFFNVSAAALLTAQFTGATTQAGSPDTADIFAVQTTAGGCGLSAGTPIPVTGSQVLGSTQTAANQFPVPIGGWTVPGTSSTIQGLALGTQAGGIIQDGHNGAANFYGGNQYNSISNYVAPDCVQAGGLNLFCLYPIISTTTFGTRGMVSGVKDNFLEMASDQGSITPGSIFAWVVMGKVTNPAINGVILEHFATNTMIVNPAYKTLTLSCSAACEILVSRIAARGGTCTSLTPQSLQVGNNNAAVAPAAGDITENACTSPATAGTAMYDVSLGTQPFVIDLSGFVNFHNGTTGGGFQVQTVAAVTGVVTASLTFVEQ